MNNDLKGFKLVAAEPMDSRIPEYECLRERGCEVVSGHPVSRIDLKYTEAQMIELCHDADAVLAMTRDPVTPALLDACPKLRLWSKYGRGIDHLPLEEAAKRGILMTNTPISHSGTVSEFAMTLLLTTMRRLPEQFELVNKGMWRNPALAGNELGGKTVGLVGFGAIGKAFAKRLAGWDVTIISYDPVADNEAAEKLGVKLVDFDTLLAESDIVSLHVPLFPSTRHMMSKKEFAKMKNHSFLINTARGALVDEEALVEALRGKKLAGAGLDVFEKEPLSKDSPLHKMPNVIIAPHISGTTMESDERIAIQATKAIVNAFLGIVPEFVVNPDGIPKWKERFGAK